MTVSFTDVSIIFHDVANLGMPLLAELLMKLVAPGNHKPVRSIRLKDLSGICWPPSGATSRQGEPRDQSLSCQVPAQYCLVTSWTARACQNTSGLQRM